MDIIRDDENKNQNEQVKDEELYFDGESYYTREEFFNPKEENEPTTKRNFKWVRIVTSFLLVIALMSSLLAMWPRLYNSAAIEFLKINHELSNNKNVQHYKESVVVVKAGNSKGTGFYFQDGRIFTNKHVIEDEPSITVSFQDGKSLPAEVVHRDKKMDIAVLKINATGLNYPTLEIEEEWEPNQSVYIIGNPLFFNFIANEGHILGITSGNEPLLVIDAPVYKGNSGSPVINKNGKVIGIVFAVTKVNYGGKEKKVGLAIPAEYAKKYVKIEKK